MFLFIQLNSAIFDAIDAKSERSIYITTFKNEIKIKSSKTKYPLYFQL